MSTTQAASANDTTSQQSKRSKPVMHVGSIGMMVGGLIAAVGGLLPWVQTPLGAAYGVEGGGPWIVGYGGVWVLSAGFLAVAGALIPKPRLALAHAALPGLFIAGIVVWQAIHLIDISASTDSWGKVLPGMGLVMAAGGAVILLRSANRIRKAMLVG